MTKLTYSGKTSSFHHKWHDTPNPEKVSTGFRKMWVLDAQWSDCPIEVYEEVQNLWQEYERGNDYYIIEMTLLDVDKEKYPYIFDYVSSFGITDQENFFIYYWW